MGVLIAISVFMCAEALAVFKIIAIEVQPVDQLIPNFRPVCGRQGAGKVSVCHSVNRSMSKVVAVSERPDCLARYKPRLGPT